MMKVLSAAFLLIICSLSGWSQNIWTKPPSRTPNDVSIDAPLMGNGDVTMSVGFKEGRLRYYLSKNDFWRLKSKGDGLSGPRVVGFLDIKTEGFTDDNFSAEQLLKNGVTSCLLKKDKQSLTARSWVSATENLIFIELSTSEKPAKVSVRLNAPENPQAKLKTGETNNVYWLTRSFEDSVDIKTEVSVALKTINHRDSIILLQSGQKIVVALAIESRFKKSAPLDDVLKRIAKLDENSVKPVWDKHNAWWECYWKKSSITIEDPILMKAYQQGQYTMAACSRDLTFPPGIFGFTTTDKPAWNGDYHLNYNFQAPFYALYAANRLAQAEPHDAPLIDFIPRGKWYAKNISNARGILYPVGIGPMGIEVTRDFPSKNYLQRKDIEQGGLFFGQRSNAAYGLLNMAQQWRCTYDEKYGKKIYPYALAIVDFWEDYLKLEDDKYVIYGDAIHEGSGHDKNPILSLGLVRNAFELIVDLSTSLKIDADRQGKWKDILARLSDFPTQLRNGKKIFRYTEQGVDWWPDNGLGIQHIYPSNAINLDSNPEMLTVANNTIDEMKRWQDMNTSSSFFMAAIRIGYDPVVVLNELRKYAQHTYPNGFQLNNPHGIENSCTVANALNEMLCMSVGNVIRLFNGLPKGQNASFENIRAWGAFLVSANRKNEIISNVNIVSEKGKTCVLVNPWPNKKVLVIRNGKKSERLQGDKISFKTKINEVIQLQVL
ncbi:glycosyl hydrolase family 95 catalytic domain-containing protein [Pedobacter borealis]|uniref:glycosyl hydrolase family 95 catalytic domain-containing protein n=1 Tax=Pedobacter borealis TaxID=475254 RepID=UPI000AB54DBF|nr:hypothetical protein [Pedobacter borealis]